ERAGVGEALFALEPEDGGAGPRPHQPVLGAGAVAERIEGLLHRAHVLRRGGPFALHRGLTIVAAVVALQAVVTAIVVAVVVAARRVAPDVAVARQRAHVVSAIRIAVDVVAVWIGVVVRRRPDHVVRPVVVDRQRLRRG